MINSVAPAYKSIDVETAKGNIRIDEGMRIKFTVDTGEVKEGFLEAIASKKKNFAFTVTPNGEAHKEIWKSEQMLPDSIEIVEERQVVSDEE